MSAHPYVRAYMAGIALPTMFLMLSLGVFVVLRLIMQVPVPIERIIVFPMAMIPNVFGLWNMLYVRLRRSRPVSIGIFGALLPFVMAPLGGAVACGLGFLKPASGGLEYFGAVQVPYTMLAETFCLAVAVYYLIWKYVVNFFNGVVGIE